MTLVTLLASTQNSQAHLRQSHQATGGKRRNIKICLNLGSYNVFIFTELMGMFIKFIVKGIKMCSLYVLGQVIMAQKG